MSSTNSQDTLTKSKQILQRRAADLARPVVDRETISEKTLELLVFKLSAEQYALETQYVKEVYPLRDFTPLPCTPPYLYGLVNLRRKILAIVDLKFFFSLTSEPEVEQKLIILSDSQKEFAILSDGIIGIQRLSMDNIEPSLPTLTGIRQDFLKGITRDGIVILDGQKLLLSKHIMVDETADTA